jgi:hypothetical protein
MYLYIFLIYAFPLALPNETVEKPKLGFTISAGLFTC